MLAINFDTLAYAKEMEAAGFTREQADAFAAAQGKILKNAFAATELATRSDVRDVRDELKENIQDVRTELKEDFQDVRNEIQNVRAELKEDIQDVRTELKEDIANTKHEILKWVMGIALAQTAAIVAIIGVAIVLVVK